MVPGYPPKISAHLVQLFGRIYGTYIYIYVWPDILNIYIYVWPDIWNIYTSVLFYNIENEFLRYSNNDNSPSR